MTLSEVKQVLKEVEQIQFQLPNGVMVPAHFHITEIGQIKKNYIDCAGVIRSETTIGFQLYTADDYDHRLSVSKLQSIIALSEKHLGLQDAPIEVEYQGDTIGKYGLMFEQGVFRLIATKTDCLAKDKCGIPQTKPKVKLSALGKSDNVCEPGSGCC